LHSLLEQPSGRLERESALNTMLMHLIVHHADHAPALRPTGREHQAVNRVQDYLHAHLSENISLQHLAELVNLHPSYLLRAFHAQIGLPPHAYLTQLRVQQAKTLLRDGISLAQIALELGFADQSHFARHFRHLVGVTPGRYARKVKNVLYI